MAPYRAVTQGLDADSTNAALRHPLKKDWTETAEINTDSEKLHGIE
jgi:hypothetical protein